MGLKRKISDEQPIKTKKKPHRVEPYWSTSKSFVAALKEERPINAVTEWLRIITEHHKSEKLSNGHTDNDEEESSEPRKDEPTENATSENETGDVEAPMDGEAEQDSSKQSTEKFADFINPYVDAFFRAGGSVSAILACGRLDTSNLCTIFQALYHIILRGNVLGAIDTSYIAGECIEFLRNNSDNTRHMLSTLRSARQNQLALEFLLAMTTVDAQVAVEVLAVADFKETNARYMTQESTFSVRKAYINLITGLLVCGDSTIVRAILIRPYFVTYVLENLVWDPADTVATFLTAIRCHLVQNRSILKAKKSEIFPGEVITSLLRLYRWGGPANKPATLAHFSKKSKAKTARPFIEVDKTELETVRASVHSLLLVLLTDHTFGLVYKDPSIGTKGQRNYLISHVFRYVEKPWNIPALGELFYRTLTANPDVIKSVLQSMKPSLEPRSTKEWAKCIELVEKVITGLHPEKIIEESLGELSLPNLMSVVVDLCVPQILVGVLCGTNGDNFLGIYGRVTHRIAQFMSHMFDNLNKVFDRMNEWRETGKMSENDVLKVRRFVNDFLIRHFPPFPIMLKSCLNFMKAPDEMSSEVNALSTSEDETTEHISILRLLLVYLKLCSKDDSSVATADAENHKILMDMFGTLKLVSDAHPYLCYDFYELLLTLKEPSFAIENESVREHVRTLFSGVLSRDENIATKAKSILGKLIKNAGLFEGNSDLPAIWLDLYRKFLRAHDLDLMMESVVRAASDPVGYRRKINKADEKTVEKMWENENLAESLHCHADEISHLFRRWEKEEPILGDKKNLWGSVSYELHTISPWLPALLDVLKEHQEHQTSKQLARRQEFLRHLLTTLLFHSSQTATLIYLVVKRDRRGETLPADLVDYLKSWKSKGSPQPLSFKENFISLVTQFLLQELAHKFDDAEALSSALREEIIEGKDESSARREIVYLVRVVVFHIVELSQRGMLTSQISQRCCQTLCVALSIAQDIHSEVLRQCLQIFLSNFNVISQFSPFDVNCSASAENLTSVVISVLQKANALCGVKNAESVISALKRPFRFKVLTELEYETRAHSMFPGKPVTVVELFEYSFEEIVELLTKIAGLTATIFWIEKVKNISDETTVDKLSFWGSVAALLLQRAADSERAAALPDDLVTKISASLSSLEKLTKPEIGSLEKAFLSYLQFRPQQTKFVSEELLPALFKARNLSEQGVDLAVWLCKRFNKSCLSNLKEAMTVNAESFQKNILLVLESMKGAFNQLEEGQKCVPFVSCLSLIARQIKSIVADETTAAKWLTPYVDFVVALFARYQRYTVSKYALVNVLKKPPAVTSDNFFFVHLISGLFWNGSDEKSRQQLTLLYLTWVSNYLQKAEKKEEDIAFISKICGFILTKMDSLKLNVDDLEKKGGDGEAKSDAKNTKNDAEQAKRGKKRSKSSTKKEKSDKIVLKWDLVLDSDTWMKFVPLALIFGLQPTDIENESKGSEARSLVLRLLGRIIEEIYSYRPDNVQIGTIFKLATAHSEFQPCMATISPVRLELAKILKGLVELSPSLMEGDHFPHFLASYKATMEPADRIILQLLDKYESANIVPPKYRSFLWGQDGASVYATLNERSSLEEYDTNRVFSLFSSDVVQRTILNYPLNRTLNVNEGVNSTTCCSESYDPAFYLPLLNNVTSPESPLKTFSFVRSGALALTLVSLSSEVENVRRMAYGILTGFVDHLYTSKGMQVEVLNRFMDSLRIGVTTLMKGDENSSPRISSVVAIFLARTSMIICNPLAPMFTTLNSFLLSKVEINLEAVPEFLGCMHSSTADYRDQRTWMLENLASGLRTQMDFYLCFHNDVPVFRILMDMFTSCVSDIDTKLKILKVMTAAVGIQDGATWLTFNCGLISWLSSTCHFGFSKNAAIVSHIVTFVHTLWTSLLKGASSDVGPSRTVVKPMTSCQLLRLLLNFIPSVSAMDTKTLAAFLSTLHELYEAGYPRTSRLLNHDVMKSIIEISSPAIPPVAATKCSSIFMFGCDFLLDEDEIQNEVSAVDGAAKNLEALTKSWVRLKSDQA